MRLPVDEGQSRPPCAGCMRWTIPEAGEQARAQLSRRTRTGSSPFARGTPRSAAHSCLRLWIIPSDERNMQPNDSRFRPVERFIPAYATNMLSDRRPVILATVHPRSRGEQFPGTRRTHPNLAHPRTCEEHVPTERLGEICYGSSPLARGTPFMTLMVHPDPRPGAIVGSRPTPPAERASGRSPRPSLARSPAPAQRPAFRGRSP